MRGLAGKVALVTGGTGLIGAAVSRRLAAEGAMVAVGSRSFDKARAWCRQPDIPSDRLFPVGIDVSSEESVRAAFDSLHAGPGRPAILVATAVPRDVLAVPFEVLSPEHFSALGEVDVAGNFLVARMLVDGLAPKETASIVWLSSIYGSAGVEHSIYPDGMMHSPVHYAATKAAVQGVVRWLAGYWGSRGVRVNAVVSGGVRATDRQDAEFVARYSRQTMLGRMAEPDEIAATCAFLASDDASYITGASIPVEGGLLAW